MKPTIQHRYTRRLKIQDTIRNRLFLKHAIATSKRRPSCLWIDGFGSEFQPGALLSPTKITQRCSITGSPRAVWESFGLARQTLRRTAVTGALSGVRRRVW